MERYEDRYRLCYVRGPEGIIVELAEQIGGGLRPAAKRLASVSGRTGAGSATDAVSRAHPLPYSGVRMRVLLRRRVLVWLTAYGAPLLA
jgi:hypothetical protein